MSVSVQGDFMRKARDVFDARVGHVLEQLKDRKKVWTRKLGQEQLPMGLNKQQRRRMWRRLKVLSRDSRNRM